MTDTLDRSKAPDVSEYPPLTLPTPTRLTLDNGIKIVILESGTQPVAQIKIVWEGGSAECHNPVVPATTMRMLSEGTSTRTADEIQYALDFNGATLREVISDHYTGIVLQCMTERVETLMPLVVETITDPTFPVERLEMLKSEFAANRQMVAQRVAIRADEECMKLMFGENHPLARIPTEERVLEMTRDDIVNWHRRLVDTGRMTVYICGKLGQKVIDSVIDILSKLQITSPDPLDISIRPFEPQDPRTVKIDMPGVLQSGVNMAIPAIDRHHPDYHDLRITVYALGGYFGSRLMSNIREQRGLTYGIQAGLSGYVEGGVVGISCDTDNKYVDEVIEQTKIEIKRLADEPPAGEELQRIRQNYMTWLASTLDSPFKTMSMVEMEQLSNAPADYFDRQSEAIRAITPEHIAEIAKTYLDVNKLRIAVAGATA